MRNLIPVLICLFLAVPCGAEIITVDDDGPADFNNIQAAIDDAINLDTVVVYPGTYTGDGNRDIDFLGKAITVRSADPNNHNLVATTVIDCNGSEADPHRGFKFHSGEGPDSIIDGLTVINGYAPNDVQPYSLWYSYGGGIYCESASPTITNCSVKNNKARNGGGGIYSDSSSSPTITGCTICRNSTDDYGSGGIQCYDATISNCLIIGNSGDSDGSGMSMYSGTLMNSTISNNIGGNSGLNCGWGAVVTGCVISMNDYYGIKCSRNSVITDCIISRNAYGGVSGFGTLRNCTISENGKYGCYSYEICIEACRIINNPYGIRAYDSDNTMITNSLIAESSQHGIYCAGGSIVTVNNSTISKNSATSYGGAIYCSSGQVTVTNCILWENSAPNGPQIAVRPNGSLSISRSDIQGGQAEVYVEDGGILNWGAGNIDADPNFAFGEDYRLMFNSPCIDAGSTADAIVFTDTTDANGTTTSIIVPDASLYEVDDEIEYDNDSVLRTVTAVSAATSTATFDDPLPVPSHWGRTINNYGWGDFEGKDRVLDGVVDMGAFEADGGGPSIALSNDRFEFFVPQGGPEPNSQTVLVRNNGMGTLQWQAEADCNWLVPTPPTGTSSGDVNEITLTIDPNDLPHGDHIGLLTISDPNAANDPRRIEVLLHVNGTLHVPSEYATIQDGIDAAVDGDTVQVANGTYTGYGNKNLDFLGKVITVRGANEPNNCIIDCEGDGVAFHFHSGEGPNSRVEALTITDANAFHEPAGAIYLSIGSPTITNCLIADNNGTGIYCGTTSSTIMDCTITRNTTTGDGGGIHCGYNAITISGCTISNNLAEGNGGGIRCYGTGLRISDCNLIGNSGTRGGAIYCYGSSISAESTTIENCIIRENSSGYKGSAIYCEKAAPEITRCTITGHPHNPSVWTGAITAYYSGEPNISDCNIVNNSTFPLWAWSGSSLYVSNCNILGNAATPIFVNSTGRATITDSAICANGNGVSVFEGREAIIANCIIAGNGGTGLQLSGHPGPSARIANCQITGNRDSSAGGIYVYYGCKAEVDQCVISGNDSTASGSGGGGVCTIGSDANTTISNCTIAYNSAASGGGVYVIIGGHNHITNSILWNNMSDIGPEIRVWGSASQPSSVSVRYSDVKGGITGALVSEYGTLLWGPGNTNQEPNFLNGPKGNWTSDGVYDSNTCQIILFDNTAQWTKGELAGKFVNPDTTQVLQFPIVSNDTNCITIWADWDTVDAGTSWVTNGPDYKIYDYHLQSQAGRWNQNLNDWVIDANTSRCIDAGNPGSLLADEPTDPNNLRINMGAYGGTAEASIPPYGWALLSDITNDGITDFNDFAHFAAFYGEQGEELPGDFNHDSNVDYPDLGLLPDLRLLCEDWLKETTWHQ